MSNKESNIAEIAEGVLEALLSAMEVDASVVLQTNPLVEEQAEAAVPITLNITGDDLGILIGRRGQTLAYLQYVVRLIVAHQTKTWVPIVVDVEGYKLRRYESLRALAWRMAEQVKVRRRAFTLEPMPAYERRIIHIALAEHADVTTESMGEGEARKVVILPREK